MGNATIDTNPAHLYRPFRTLMANALAETIRETVGKHGVDGWRLVEGYRSPSRQIWLYAQGRTRPGAIVTHTLHSLHCYGIAADCVPIDSNGNDMWDAHPDIWAQYGHCLRAVGLEWGGDFPKLTGGTFVDQPHGQATASQRDVWVQPARAWIAGQEWR